MSLSKGRLRFEPLFTTDELGLHEYANIEHIVKAFLSIGDAIAARQIEMPNSILLLQAVADNPASGAIYLYSRDRRQFYLAVFEHGREDALTTTEFEQLVEEYDLLGIAERGSKPLAIVSSGNA
jgi:hypothetical protein